MRKVVWFAGWFTIVLISWATAVVLGVGRTAAVEQPLAEPLPEIAIVDSEGAVDANARVVPIRSAMLEFANKGVGEGALVQDVLVKEGDVVPQGTHLAQLDARALQLAVDQARIALTEAQGNLDKLRGNADAARLRTETDIARVQAEAIAAKLRAESDAAKLRAEASSARLLGRVQAAAALDASANSLLQAAATLEANALSTQEKLTAALNAENAANAAQISSAEAQVQQADVTLRGAELALEQTALRAPFDGTVVAVNVKPGELPSALKPAIILADMSAWQIVADNLSDTSIVEVRVGDPAVITFDALADFQLIGTVTSISAIGTSSVDNRATFYSVIITPQESDERLRWNMNAQVSIKTGDVARATPTP